MNLVQTPNSLTPSIDPIGQISPLQQNYSEEHSSKLRSSPQIQSENVQKKQDAVNGLQSNQQNRPENSQIAKTDSPSKENESETLGGRLLLLFVKKRANKC